MALIPASQRSPITALPVGRSVAAMCAALPALPSTIGVASISASASLVELGGVRSGSTARTPCAVAVTSLEKRGDRIWGIPCSGVGPYQATVQSVTQPVHLGNAAAADGLYFLGEITNPFSAPATLVLSGNVDQELFLDDLRVEGPFNGGVAPHYISRTRTVPAEGKVKISALTYKGSNTNQDYVGFDGSAAWSPLKDTLDWRPAVAALSWVTGGLPWWGVIEDSARAGQWVRRAAWEDSSRAIRFEPGAGTTRAVAVQTISGGAVSRVTTADFGAAEFLAEDWRTVSAGVAEKIDVSAFVPSAATSAFYVAAGTAGTGTAGTPNPFVPGIEKGTGTGTGSGFVYLSNGVMTLVDGEVFSTGEIWRP